MIGDPGEPLAPVHDVLEDWDYERDIEVAVQLNVDFRAAAQALGIVPEDLALAVVLKGGSGAGSMPRWIDTLDIREIDIHSATADMAAQISSRQLSGRLRLEVARSSEEIANSSRDAESQMDWCAPVAKRMRHIARGWWRFTLSD